MSLGSGSRTARVRAAWWDGPLGVWVMPSLQTPPPEGYPSWDRIRWRAVGMAVLVGITIAVVLRLAIVYIDATVAGSRVQWHPLARAADGLADACHPGHPH